MLQELANGQELEAKGKEFRPNRLEGLPKL